uniref:Uncharacterized protein n=1 Tax=Anguilla anguilla TaxID=7936 RepID=A0A0E9THR7_ANGAN
MHEWDQMLYSEGKRKTFTLNLI